jgi:hypothetical protein
MALECRTSSDSKAPSPPRGTSLRPSRNSLGD